jgi:hypothetical protein
MDEECLLLINMGRMRKGDTPLKQARAYGRGMSPEGYRDISEQCFAVKLRRCVPFPIYVRPAKLDHTNRAVNFGLCLNQAMTLGLYLYCGSAFIVAVCKISGNVCFLGNICDNLL